MKTLIAALTLALISSSAFASCPIHDKRLCRQDHSGAAISYPRFISNTRDGVTISNVNDGYLIKNTGNGVTIDNVGSHVRIDNAGKGVQIYNTGDGVRVAGRGAEVTSTQNFTSKGRSK